MRPSLDIDQINSRLDFVSVFVRPDNQLPCQRISKSLSKIKNMRKTTTLLRKGIDNAKQKRNAFKSGVWASLLEFCYHTIDIADRLGEVSGADHLPLRIRAAEVLDRNALQRIGRIVHDTVDLASSGDQHRTVVKRGTNQHLDQIKEMYDGMEKTLSEKTVKITGTMPPGSNVTPKATYLPHLGFHLSVPLNQGTGEPVYDGAELGWERV